MERANKSLSCILLFLLTIILIVCAFPINSVHADMGPKEAFDVVIDNLPQSDYVVTIMTKDKSGETAPNISHVYDFLNKEDKKKVNKLIDRLNQENIDAYFILEDIFGIVPQIEDNTTTISYTWDYYPSSKFYIVIYDLNNDILYVSNYIHKVVFTSAYRASYDEDFTIEREGYVSFKTHEMVALTALRALRNSNYDEETAIKLNIVYNVLLLLVRIAATLAIEMLLALCFKFTKESYKIIAITNVITQLFLNVAILLGNLFGGVMFGPFLSLVLGEFIIFIVEPIVYKKKCIRQNGTKKLIVFYALLANFLSLAAGFGIYILNMMV
ncbi:MAG: hypothetical protein K5923_00900 [Clostridia bacterium]|nr:hypothetical protein [Clostridia bacterium]